MFSLRNKLFLAFLLSGTLLVASMLALFQWSFDRGFLHYINQLEQKRLEFVGTVLEQRYADDGGWDLLRQNGDLESLLGSMTYPRYEPSPPDLPRQLPKGDNGSRPPPPPPPPGPRVFVLDANQQPMAGRYRKSGANVLRPLLVDGHLVGYVGLRPKKMLLDFVDQQFAAAQSRNFIYMALLALLISVLVAFPLASLLVKRIARLVEQVQQLSQGNFDHRIALSGQDELNQLALHLNDLGHTLQQSAHSRRKMVADISHELRTPIATLRAQLEAIEDGVRPLDSSAIKRLHDQVMRLSTLVNDLYELSLADIGALNYRKQTLDLRVLLATLATSMLPQFQRANLQFSLQEKNPAPLLVFGDEQRLNQLFANLLQNSLQYTTAPGKVTLDIVADKNAVLVTVSDSAPGVEKSLQPRLFERLFRTESSRNRNSGGAGLGLSLCQTITQAHNGNISIADSPLGGLAVTVLIPLATP